MVLAIKADALERPPTTRKRVRTPKADIPTRSFFINQDVISSRHQEPFPDDICIITTKRQSAAADCLRFFRIKLAYFSNTSFLTLVLFFSLSDISLAKYIPDATLCPALSIPFHFTQ